MADAQGLELAMIRTRGEEPNSARDLERLVRIGVVSGERGARLQRVRELRRLMVHDYPGIKGAQIHEAVSALVDEWPAYQRDFQNWVKKGFKA